MASVRSSNEFKVDVTFERKNDVVMTHELVSTAEQIFNEMRDGRKMQWGARKTWHGFTKRFPGQDRGVCRVQLYRCDNDTSGRVLEHGTVCDRGLPQEVRLVK